MQSSEEPGILVPIAVDTPRHQPDPFYLSSLLRKTDLLLECSKLMWGLRERSRQEFGLLRGARIRDEDDERVLFPQDKLAVTLKVV